MSAKIPVNRVKDTKGSKETKPGKDTIYIDVDDEITAIIDKVEAAKNKIVALVLPKRANALQSVVNMRLLKRSAERAGKNLVLVTSEGALLPLAGAAGLHVAKDLQSPPEVPPSPIEAIDAPEPELQTTDISDEADINPEDAATKIDYKKSIGELAAVHAMEDDAIELNEPEDELPMAKAAKVPKTPKDKDKKKKLKVPNFERFRLMLFGGIGLLIALIIFIILAIFVLPKGLVTINTTSLPVSANLTLDGSDKYTSLNIAKNQIPVALKTSKQTSNQTVTATGQQNLGTKATGSVVMSAGPCTGTYPNNVGAGTAVSYNGLVFITQKPAQFTTTGPPTCTYRSNSVPILAQSGGTKYNSIPSGTAFSVSASGVTATSDSTTTGGTDNNVTIVSQADVDGAKAKVTSTASDAFTKTFEQQLASQGYYVLGSTLKINDPVVTSTPAVGTQASTAAVNVEITYTVLAVKKDDLRSAISDALTKQVDKTKQKLSNDDVLNGATVSVQNQTSPTTATITVNEDTTAIPIINTAQVKALAAGKKSGDIETAISTWPGVKSVDVKFSPFWVSKAPKAGKITVKTVQVKG